MKRNYITASLIFAIAVFSIITLVSGVSKESRYGKGDLMDELYEQATKQNNNLKDIEEGIDKFHKNKQDALEKYNSYTNYNTRYYADAKTHAAAITDATTRQKALDMISKSEVAYNNGLTNWKNHIATLNVQERELKDLHELLEVLITIPMIEKHQQSSLPDNNKLKETNTDHQQVIEKIKAITK